MHTTTAHTLPARYVGERHVTVTLTFDAIRNAAGFPLAVPGASVAYRVSTGDATITGDDLRSPLGFRPTPDDPLRSLCSFLRRTTARDVPRSPRAMRGIRG